MLNIAKIEMLISEKGWKKPYFCSLFGKERGWISDWKRGRGLPDENTAQAIATVLGTTVEYLTDKSEQKIRPSTEAEGLTDKERALLDSFRSMTDDAQDSFLNIAAAASAKIAKEEKK